MIGIIVILVALVVVICVCVTGSAGDLSSRDQMVDSYLLGRTRPAEKTPDNGIRPN